MRRLGIGLVLAAAAAGQELDRDTLAGMDAEVRGDWVRAVEAFERAAADTKDPSAGARLRAARKRGVDAMGAAVARLLKLKRNTDAAAMAAVGMLVDPKHHRFAGAAKRLARKGVAVPKVLPDSEGAVEAYPRRSPGARLRCYAVQGADFGRAEELIDRCLAYLAETQEKNGSWDSDKYGGGEHFDVGITSLVVLAHLTRGPAGLAGPPGETVRKAVRWLGKQEEDGTFGTRATMSFIYNTAFAAQALAEYAAIAGTQEFQGQLERAKRFLVDAQNKAGGWRYAPRDEPGDTSMTCRVVEALHALGKAGFGAPAETLASAAAFVDNFTDDGGQTGYNFKGGQSARNEKNFDQFPPEFSQAMTAAGCLTRLYAGRDAATMGASLALVASVKPIARLPDRYYWEIGARALQAGWGYIPHAWYGALVDTAEEGIAEDGAMAAEGVWTIDGGLVYATAMTALALAGPYREAPPRVGPATRFYRAKRRTVTVGGKAEEVPTGIYVDRGTVLELGARGVIRPLGDDGPSCDTDGLKKGARGAKRRINGPFACLLGRVGKEGKPFRLEAGETWTSKEIGHLFLLINDADPSDNSRGWTVELRLERQ